MNKTVLFASVLVIILTSIVILFIVLKTSEPGKSSSKEISLNDNGINHNIGEVPYKTPKVPPICDHSLMINDTNGNFEKIACYISYKIYEPLPPDEASKFCIKHQMKLFKFDSVESYNGWFKLANSIWSPHYGAAVWVNGKRNNDCSGTFKIVDDEEEQLIKGNIQYRDLESICGKCLRMIQDNQGGFYGTPWDCEKIMAFFCELRL